ncbi:MAG TPA: CdaR family protein [Pyrinomonadaceae bacterium]|nr:CdaR family protein [Pyrinomonadaceae bacterium]
MRKTQSNTRTTQQILWRWTREFLFEDWGLKLLALGITIVLWFAVNEQRSPASLRLRGIKLGFVVPEEMELTGVNRDEVRITLEGSRHALDRLNVRDLTANVDVANYQPGERVVKLTPDKIVMELPDGVRLKEVEPNSVSLRVERRIEREVDVKVRFEGAPPPGYEVKNISVEPRRVKVRGPAGPAEALGEVATETISLDNHAESFTERQIAVDTSDPRVMALDPLVSVRVEIGPIKIDAPLVN